jgi:hypothetical protein
VAVGGGAVAAVVPGAILASRSGPQRRVAVARGRVTALAADGARVAWTERVTVGGKLVQRVRLARVP